MREILSTSGENHMATYNKDLKRLHRPPSLPQSVQTAIREFILDNNLKSGDALPPETQLTKQLGVSRNAVREAVKALELVGIVEVRRGSGLFVGDFSLEPLLDNLPYGLMSDLQELRELLEIRQVLEIGMVEHVIAHRTDEQIETLRQIVERMRSRAEQKKAFPKEDREFHQRMLQNAENGILLKLLDVFWLTYNRASHTIDIEDYDPMSTYRDHVEIVDAIAAGDVERTKRALEKHYTGLGSLRFRIEQARHDATIHNKEETA